MWLGMVRMSSTRLSTPILSRQEQQTCLQVARDSILHGLQHGTGLDVVTQDYAPTLQQQLACFVTLHKHGQLRGCIGALEAYQPLINDVAEHAFAAAFQDPRFSALQQDEYEQTTIDISVLGKPEPMRFENEVDLLRQIRPGVDGLILEHGYNRGTFLPSVWEQLPDAKEFLQHLKNKAGLPMDWWSDDVKISRYETFIFS